MSHLTTASCCSCFVIGGGYAEVEPTTQSSCVHASLSTIRKKGGALDQTCQTVDLIEENTPHTTRQQQNSKVVNKMMKQYN